MKNSPPGIVSLVLLMLMFFCSQQVSVNSQGGGGSEVEVVGQVVFPGNVPAPYTQVKLIPVNHNPAVKGDVADSLIDTSDANGQYTFKNIQPGIYNVQAVQLENRTRMLVFGVEVTGETTFVSIDSLQKPGSIKLIPGIETEEGYVTIPGTDIAKQFDVKESEILIDSVPAGKIPEIRYVTGRDSAVITKQNVLVKSSDTTIITNFTWDNKRSIYLNTTVSGAGVDSDVYDFPVLVRLTESNFDFSQAAENGKDIRFTSRNGTPLLHEIEKWDGASRHAAIWVRIDTVYGNDSTQSILMYWGNPDAQDYSNSKLVFDTASGFQGVWHLGDGPNDLIRDATYNGYEGSSPDTSTPSISEGAIGYCRTFNGTSDFITMNNTSESKINFPQDGYYSVSAWVSLDAIDIKSRCIVSKGYEQYYLRSSSFSVDIMTTSPLWEFVEFDGEEKVWEVTNSPVTEKQWVHLVGVRKGTQQYLYCNGALVDSTIDKWPNEIADRKSSNDLSIGRFAEVIQIPFDQGFGYFKGSIDEVRIISTAVSPQWIRLCYMNQKSEDKLVVFK